MCRKRPFATHESADPAGAALEFRPGGVPASQSPAPFVPGCSTRTSSPVRSPTPEFTPSNRARPANATTRPPWPIGLNPPPRLPWSRRRRDGAPEPCPPRRRMVADSRSAPPPRSASPSEQDGRAGSGVRPGRNHPGHRELTSHAGDLGPASKGRPSRTGAAWTGSRSCSAAASIACRKTGRGRRERRCAPLLLERSGGPPAGLERDGPPPGA